MKHVTPEISWHGRDPVYSADFQPLKDSVLRMATCGTDKNIRIWEVSLDADAKVKVTFLSSLNRHTRAVNVVRFSPNGQILASGADDSSIILWKRNPMPPSAANIFADEEEENRESWTVFKVLRSHLEDVYDLSWSSDGLHLLSGSVDNTAILWDVRKGQKLWMFTDHKSFVQGVAFDPLGAYLASISCDRSCRVYSMSTRSCVQNITKMPSMQNNNNSTCPSSNIPPNSKSKSSRIFHDDTMKSFFRRMSFSPDGQLLVVPSGCLEANQTEQNSVHTTLVFSRHNFSKPVIHLPGPSKATILVRFNPVLYVLRPIQQSNQSQSPDSIFSLPYRMVFAVGSEDSVVLYDTQQPRPFALLSNIHYHTLSDLSWSHDGRFLSVSSTDGFITLVTFAEGELGEAYHTQVVTVMTQSHFDEAEKEKAEAKKSRTKKDIPMAVDSEEPSKEKDTSDANASSRQDEVMTSGPEVVTSRRVQLTTLQSVPSNQVSDDSSECPLQLELTSDAILPEPSSPLCSQSTSFSSPFAVKTPRRIQPVLLQASSSSPSSGGGGGGGRGGGGVAKEVVPSPKPRRVQLTTLKSD
ncbi:hypothetical protein CAPTEDRAFT_226807 [Capitella teleta]|uniref:CAF1B/HIR1 beta-propeller domain-containing protein n=1 Tax=Capitella teleta TaxID=283909 RepID=R7TRR5_CAPTE|nr:hypothetical protein CAPTEDRAFT_226807 [Capitella teleta]|eukprot:ELT96618.1 hypothetical protein CAPTEDRAFT_226807 [Capitella teleta]